jgi:hypothetical protein
MEQYGSYNRRILKVNDYANNKFVSLIALGLNLPRADETIASIFLS